MEEEYKRRVVIHHLNKKETKVIDTCLSDNGKLTKIEKIFCWGENILPLFIFKMVIIFLIVSVAIFILQLL